MWGYNRNELIDKNVKILMNNQDAENHDNYLNNFLKTGQPKIIGIGRQVVAKRKDGTTFNCYLAIGESKKKKRTYFYWDCSTNFRCFCLERKSIYW